MICCWIGPAFRRRCHPVHVAVRAIGQELHQPFRGERDRIGAGHADDVEAMIARRSRELGLQRGRIVQKSRLTQVSDGGMPADRLGQQRAGTRVATSPARTSSWRPRPLSTVHHPDNRPPTDARPPRGRRRSAARRPVAGAHQPADVGQMIADVVARRTDHLGIRGRQSQALLCARLKLGLEAQS